MLPLMGEFVISIENFITKSNLLLELCSYMTKNKYRDIYQLLNEKK